MVRSWASARRTFAFSFYTPRILGEIFPRAWAEAIPADSAKGLDCRGGMH